MTETAPEGVQTEGVLVAIEKEIKELTPRQVAEMIKNEREARKKAEGEAETDPLTGVLSRKAFLHRAESYFGHAQREGEPFAVGYIDMDKFKAINDNFGHDVGDHVLRETGRALQESIRQSDFAGRLGGDELAIVFVGWKREDLSLVAKRLSSSLSTVTIPGKDGETITLPIGLSLGIVEWRGEDSFRTVLKKADEEMYRIKKERKIGTNV